MTKMNSYYDRREKAFSICDVHFRKGTDQRIISFIVEKETALNGKKFVKNYLDLMKMKEEATNEREINNNS